MVAEETGNFSNAAGSCGVITIPLVGMMKTKCQFSSAGMPGHVLSKGTSPALTSS